MGGKGAARFRRVGAGFALLLAVVGLPFAYLASRSFVETYGLGGDSFQVLVLIEVVVGTVVAGLALLSRRLAGRRSPNSITLVVIGLVAVAVPIAAGAALGQRDWSQACEAGTVACEP